jgi:hypothetical protein
MLLCGKVTAELMRAWNTVEEQTVELAVQTRKADQTQAYTVLPPSQARLPSCALQNPVKKIRGPA